jgi:surface protein
MLNIRLLSSLSISLLLLFSACTEKDDEKDKEKGNQDKVLTGQLIDSAVQGVKYETNSGVNGYTDEKGTFTYNEKDKTISFTVGSLTIAKDFTLSKLNSDGNILPADIVGVDRTNISVENIIKLLRVLQSLDNDNNPDNGIFIDDNTKGYLSENINIIDANISTLKTMVEKALKTFISQRKAKDHYIKSLKAINITAESLPFITIWQTTSADESITIPINQSFKDIYDYTVDWGDGNIENNITTSKTHTYSSDGNHTVKISGEFPAMKMVEKESQIFLDTSKVSNANKLKKITQWGDIKWRSFQNAFAQSNLDVNATDIPDFSNVTSTRLMFWHIGKLKGNNYFNEWNVSNVTDMNGMFRNSNAFNQPLDSWDVSNVIDMTLMFFAATNFNQPLNDWNVSKVTSMRAMFGFMHFNQPLNKWDVSNVTNMGYMFRLTTSFNQNLSDWNVSKVTDMTKMFINASAFTGQNLSGWNVGNVPSDKHADFMTDSGGGNTEPNWN